MLAFIRVQRNGTKVLLLVEVIPGCNDVVDANSYPGQHYQSTAYEQGVHRRRADVDHRQGSPRELSKADKKAINKRCRIRKTIELELSILTSGPSFAASMLLILLTSLARLSASSLSPSRVQFRASAINAVIIMMRSGLVTSIFNFILLPPQST